MNSVFEYKAIYWYLIYLTNPVKKQIMRICILKVMPVQSKQHLKISKMKRYPIF